LKKHLNTLYLTKPGTYLHRERETIIVEQDKQKIAQLPVHGLESIVCLSYDIMISPGLMQLCSESGITLAIYDGAGRFISRVEGPVKGNILLRKEQYRQSDCEIKSLKIAKMMVGAKITNSKAMVSRCLRNYPDHLDKEKLIFTVEQLQECAKKVKTAASLAELRGYEGEAAIFYFKTMNCLLAAGKQDFVFENRNRRPPTDPFNSLLSYSYTLLYHDAVSALEGVGLDPAAGFLHRDRPGRMSLALDLMEEFRAYLADRLAINLINLGQITIKDFKTTESGAVNIGDDAKKTLLSEYQKRKAEEITHPFIEEKCTIGMLMHIQAKLLAGYLRKDYEYYPAFLVR